MSKHATWTVRGTAHKEEEIKTAHKEEEIKSVLNEKQIEIATIKASKKKLEGTMEKIINYKVKLNYN
jgi:Tfp pilus assembly protein PilO